jgi:isovaleryl-CoA dehydrogenase
MEYLFSGRLRELVGVAEDVAEHIAVRAAAVDREAVWPAHSFAALKAAGLMGLNAPERLGGEQQGMVGLVAVTEVLARACSSSAICYAMHCVATAVVAAKATPAQEARYLLPIAAGEHVSTLALSESGTGSHFYLPQARLERGPEGFEISGLKQFVTSGAHADSYVVSAVTPEVGGEVGDFSCLVLDADQDGMSWLPPWQGLGMRGNSSRGLRLERVRVPFERLLGEPGDQIWYVFEVIAPYFLMAMSATPK